MPSRHVIATVAVGERFERLHRRAFAWSLERYATQHAYDLVVVDTPLIPPPDGTTPNATECGFSRYLVASMPEVADAARLMYVDADVLIGPNTPPFHEVPLGDGIGVVDEWCQPSRQDRLAYQDAHGFETSPKAYYAASGFDLDIGTLVNSGVFICEPRRHATWLAEFAHRHAPIGVDHPRGLHYEQAAFGAELERANLATMIPTPWNRIWPVHRWHALGRRHDPSPRRRLAALPLLRRHLQDAFGLHLAAGIDHDLAAVLAAADRPRVEPDDGDREPTP
ncbi:MAG: hypothetical protein ACYTFH_05475 [Planctomycetota bacterium]|jgi:hypothetical protein